MFFKRWYYDGLIKLWQNSKEKIVFNYKYYYLKTLFRNLFQPLFGYSSRVERFIAFFVRFFHLLSQCVLFLGRCLLNPGLLLLSRLFLLPLAVWYFVRLVLS